VPLVERARMKDGNRRSLVRERPAAPDNSQPRIAGQPNSVVISRQFLAKKNKSPQLAGAVRLLSQASNLTPKVPALTQFNPALDAEGLRGSTRK